jgi:hypothetical protein
VSVFVLALLLLSQTEEIDLGNQCPILHK